MLVSVHRRHGQFSFKLSRVSYTVSQQKSVSFRRPTWASSLHELLVCSSSCAISTSNCVNHNSTVNWTSGQSNLTQGRIAAAHGRFSRILQVAPMCTPYIESQKWLPWQHTLEPRNRLWLHRIAWLRKPTPRIKQHVASYHTTEVIADRKSKSGCHGNVP